MAGLIDALQKTISQNPEDQKRALASLNEASTSDFPRFVNELSTVLRTLEVEPFVRQAAGLQLKNVLYSKDENVKHQHLTRWLQMPTAVRNAVKENVVRSLGTERGRPSIAAQCVAAIACAELPTMQWPDVIQFLMHSVTAPGSTAELRESCLETLGYICQDINAEVLKPQSNEILTAIVHGMGKNEPSNHVKLAATNAMLNSLEFTRSNFGSDAERNVIMQVVCESTQCPDTLVKVSALQCLVKIMSLYYQFMESYMRPALFPITVDAMKSDVPEVSLQGIEFWSNVCEEEIALSVEAEEAEENSRVPEQTSKHYGKGACSHLCPILLETMAKQDEADDEDEWTPSKAAGVCVMLLAQCVGDTIVASVMPFFQHFGSQDWRYKEAAILAFGSILDGPDPSTLSALVEQAMPALIEALTHRNVKVRDTAAWTIGRVCELCGDVVTRPVVLQSLLPAMSQALQQEPRVATNVCWALNALAKSAYDSACMLGTDASGQPQTFVLTGCFEGMVNELIKTSDRPDGSQSNLRLAAFETLMELIKNSPKDCYPVVQSTTLVMLQKLEQLLNMEIQATTQSDKQQVVDLQALLCATLQSVLRKIRSEDIPHIGEPILKGLLQIMERSAGKGGHVMEEALIAMSSLVEVLGRDFIPYMETLKPHLMRGLSSFEDASVCNASVGVITDLCRSLEKNVAPILDDVMNVLVESIRNPKLNRDVKVGVLGCFGDVALAIGTDFERYIQPVTALLQEAAAAAQITNAEDLDQIDYVEKLRENCIMTYVGILQGLRSYDAAGTAALQQAQQSIGRFVPNMLQLLHAVCDTQPVPASDVLISAAAGLIGDLANLYGAQIVQLFDIQKVQNLLQRGRRSKTSKTKSLSNWATKELRKVSSPA